MARRKATTSTDSKPQHEAASEAGSQNAQTAPAGSEQEPATDPAEGAAGSKQEFEVKRPLLHDGEELPPGSTVALTRKQFLALKAVAVIDGEWPEDQEA